MSSRDEHEIRLDVVTITRVEAKQESELNGAPRDFIEMWGCSSALEGKCAIRTRDCSP